MGIHNFTSFINNINGVRIKHELGNTPVIIDGLNIMGALERKTGHLLYGGNYSAFAREVRLLFSALKHCNVDPIVMICTNDTFNYNHEVNEKLKIVNKSIKYDNSIELENEIIERILPLLSRDVFKSVLTELGIKHFQDPFNASVSMAKMANHLKCAIISDYSNFFAFDLNYGVISFDSMNWQEICDSSPKYIECQIYSINRFVKNFSGLRNEMLPIFAAIIGCEYNSFKPYVDMFGNKPFYQICDNWINYDDLNIRFIFKFMFIVLNWLENKDKSAACNYLKNYLKQNYRDVESFNSSVESYDISVTQSYFNEYLESNGQNLESIVDNIIRETKQFINLHLDHWFISELYLTSKLDLLLIYIITHKPIILKSLIEDIDMSSVYICSLKILSSIYGLLRDKQNGIPIDIILRVNDKLSNFIGFKPFHLTDNPEFQDLRNINVTKINRKSVVLKLMDFDEKFYFNLWQSFSDKQLNLNEMEIEFWIFAVLLIKYWMINTNNQLIDSKLFINSLLISIIWEKYGMITSFSQLIKAKGLRSDVYPIALKVVHSFNEFQCCAYFVRILNGLMQFPFTDNSLICYLNGLLIHNLYVECDTHEQIIESEVHKRILGKALQAINEF